MISRKFIWAVVAFCFASGALAQENGVTMEQQPDGSGVAIGPVVDSTERFFPQIQAAPPAPVQSPLNPKKSPQIPLGPPNNLFVPTVTSSTQGVPGPKFAGINYTFFNPADPFIAVGYNHVVEVVNVTMAFFDKVGNKQFEQSLGSSGFFSGVAQTNFVFDPKVIFDSSINKFIVIAVEQRDSPANSAILLAVSDDGNPNGVWTKYRIDNRIGTAVNYWFDYPTVGSNKSGLVISGNEFTFGGNSFGFARSYTFNKAQIAARGTLNFFYFNHTDDFTLQPARSLENVTTTIYGTSVRNNTTFTMYAWRNFSTTPVFNRVFVTVPTFSSMTSDATSAGGALLDPLSDRMMDTSFRSGSLLAAHTIKASSTDNRAMVRWYEFLVNSWPVSGSVTRKQYGNVTLASPNHVFMPAISKNGKGAISMVVTRSNSTRAADLYTVSHKSTDPLNSMGPFTNIGSSSANYSAGFHRWGDYFCTTNDPSDAAKFWCVGMVIKTSSQWGTQISTWSVN